MQRDDRQFVCHGILSCIALACQLVGCGASNVPASGESIITDDSLTRNEVSQHTDRSPLPIVYRVPQLSSVVISDAEREAIQSLWPRKGDSLGVVLHALHAFRDPGFVPRNSGLAYHDLLAVLVDYRVAWDWYDGQQPFIATRYGLRYATPWIAQDYAHSHVDQAFALLGLLGVPPDYTVITPNRPATVSEFIADAKATFRLEGEFEWSVLGLLC